MLLPTLSTSSLAVIKSSLLQPQVPRIGDSFSSQEITTEHDGLERNSGTRSGGGGGKFLRGRKADGSFHWIRVSMSNTTKLWGDSHPVNITAIIFFCWVLEGKDGFLVPNSYGAQQSLDFFESSEFISDHVFTMHGWFLYIHCSFFTCGYCGVHTC